VESGKVCRVQFKFEKFTKTGSSFAPVISVRKEGAIGVSQGALNRFGLADGEWYVVLYYDRDANVIGIQPTQAASEEGAIKLIKRSSEGRTGKASVSSSVSAKSFFEYYGLPTAETRSYLATQDEQTKMIIIDLNKPLKTDKNEKEAE
jgi:hypothetical protein